MNRILFRADADGQLGMGHVMRCLALADMLDDQHDRYLAIVTPAPSVRALIEEAGLTVIELPATGTGPAFLDQLTEHDDVVLDGYTFSKPFQRAIRARAGRLFLIDDLLDGHQVAQTIINHAGGISPGDYDADPETHFCLGPHYALLRPAFLQARGYGETPTEGPFFVSMGGADVHNVSLTVLQAIQQLDASQAVQVVLGPFHPGRPLIEAFREQLPNLTILQNLSADDMADQLQACSLAITACSTIAYEVCAINRPLIGIMTADNQDRLARFLSDEKLALSVHFPHQLSRMTPSVSLETMLKLAIQAAQFSPETVEASLASQRRYFDGQSPDRFRALFAR
ncbi:hypothetical protein GCM10027578_34320 [Spirosoma luteolum]